MRSSGAKIAGQIVVLLLQWVYQPAMVRGPIVKAEMSSCRSGYQPAMVRGPIVKAELTAKSDNAALKCGTRSPSKNKQSLVAVVV